MSYVIRRIDQGGGYVAKPGSGPSYTSDLRLARKYQTRQEAETDRCVGNEVIVDLEQLLDQYRR
jgi:hypothetical protein